MLNESKDFRLIKPIRRNEKYLDVDRTIFLIPCKLLEIGDKVGSKSFKIKIEILDFDSGKLITRDAITWEKTLELFTGMDLTPPFMTDCKFFYEGSKKQFVVYGIFAIGLMEDIFGDENEYDDEALNKIFMENYKELRQWIDDHENNGI